MSAPKLTAWEGQLIRKEAKASHAYIQMVLNTKAAHDEFGRAIDARRSGCIHERGRAHHRRRRKRWEKLFYKATDAALDHIHTNDPHETARGTLETTWLD